MRVHSVEIAGFGPFLEPQRVDFDAFADHGIFLVQGRTGAGKSSILDAVVYALYNSAPRYGSGGATNLRSHHCGPEDPTWVELEFSVDGCRHRLRRSPEYERPKTRGKGMTPERAKAQLWRLEGEAWTGIEANPRKVAQALDELLPLTRTQFLQVVMLAQGQFERFLVAESAARKELLGALFDTKRFEAIDALLQQRVSAARAQLSQATSATDALVDTLASHLQVDRPDEPDEEWLRALLATVATDVGRAVAEHDRTRADLAAARARHDRAREVQTRQGQRLALEARRQVLAAERDDLESVRLSLERARAAAQVRPVREELQRHTQRHDEASSALAKVCSRYEETCGNAVPEELAAQRDALVAAIPAVERAVRAEEDLRRESAQLDRCRRQLRESEELDLALARELEVHRRVLAREVEVTVEQVEAESHTLVTELAQARRHQAAVDQRRKAEVAALEAGEERTRASGVLDELRRRSLEQYAGRLAESLETGCPCPVCGATNHPAPAARVGETVDDEDLEAAETAFDRAQATCVRTESDLAASRAREAALEGARPVAVVSELVTGSARRLDEARAQQVERQRAEEQVSHVLTARQEGEVARAGLQARIASLMTTIEGLDAEVRGARGGAETVADRLQGLRDELAVVEHVQSARRVLERAEQERDAASERLRDSLSRHDFSSLDECLAAEVPTVRLAALEERVRRHDEAWTVTLAGLAAPELQELPEEPVDLTGPEAALATATQEHDVAVGAVGVARQRQATAESLVAQVREAWTRHASAIEAFDVLRRLAATVHGEPPNTRRLRLESYVLSVELEQIVLAANRRLAVMSGGRYELLLSDQAATRGNNAGLEVRVLDQHTQETRAPESLSGGEKFLASLALALGLAEVVTERAGGVTLDTLFIDEGFGSLDAETLDLAMHTLDQLREHGRTVGVISHVEAMKERIPAQLVVEHSAGGWSRVRAVT